MSNLTNITMQVPSGATQHGNSHLLCVKGPPWRDALNVVTFFATNYVAHAATVKSTPGEGAIVAVCNVFLALLFPMSGLLRAMNAIARLARFGGSELKNACRAGALCMVVRGPSWFPDETEDFDAVTLGVNDGDGKAAPEESNGVPIEAKLAVYLPSWAREDCSLWAYFDTIGSRAYVDRKLARIHGRHHVPPGYEFAIVARNTTLLPLSRPSGSDQDGIDVSSSYSVAKALASLIQAIAAFSTLLGHRSDLIERWGYASFHLTVIPYLVMTVLNFLSNTLTADYPCLFVVESDTMDEARAKGGVFEGTVAATKGIRGSGVATKAELSGWNGLQEQNIFSAATSATTVVSLGFWLGSLGIIAKRRGSNERKRHMMNFRLIRTEHLSANQDQSSSSETMPSLQHKEGPIRLAARESIYFQSQDDNAVQFHVQPSRDGRKLNQKVKIRLQALWSKHSLKIRRGEGSGRAKNDDSDVRSYLFHIMRTSLMPSLRLFDETIGRYVELFTAEYRKLDEAAARPQSFVGNLRILANSYATICQKAFESPESKEAVIYIPACSRIHREDDPTSTVDEGLRPGAALLPMIGLGTSPELNKFVPRAKHRGNPGLAMSLEMLLGCLILGLVLVLIAWLSDWFDPGQSTTTEKVIMLLWICEGTFGLLLPMVSAKELILIFFLLPFYAVLGSLIMQASATLYLAFAPLGIFVAPIWGFVIVGKMLVSWGSCVVLY